MTNQKSTDQFASSSWQFVPYDDADPTTGYYTLEVGPFYVVIEPDIQEILVRSAYTDDQPLAQKCGFSSLPEAKSAASRLIISLAAAWLVEINRVLANNR